jgi:hypothetical protein
MVDWSRYLHLSSKEVSIIFVNTERMIVILVYLYISMISRVAEKILECQNGRCLFIGKIVEVSRVRVGFFVHCVCRD